MLCPVNRPKYEARKKKWVHKLGFEQKQVFMD
jgi:hypothetical protein